MIPGVFWAGNMWHNLAMPLGNQQQLPVSHMITRENDEHSKSAVLLSSDTQQVKTVKHPQQIEPIGSGGAFLCVFVGRTVH